MHDCESVEPRSEVVDYDSGALRQALQLPHRRRFQNIEDTKKYKARKKGFPSQRDADQSHQLPRHFVNHNELWILDPGSPNHASGRGNSGQCNRCRSHDRRPRTCFRRDPPTNESPQDNSCDRSPSPRTGLQTADTAKRGDETCPTVGVFHSTSSRSRLLSRMTSSSSLTGSEIT